MFICYFVLARGGKYDDNPPSPLAAEAAYINLIL